MWNLIYECLLGRPKRLGNRGMALKAVLVTESNAAQYSYTSTLGNGKVAFPTGSIRTLRIFG